MDLLNIVGDEGLGYPDLTYGFNEVPTGLLRELTDGVLQPGGGASIFSGFVPSVQSAGGPVVVGQTGVANRALLSQVVGGKLVTGTLVAGGAESQAIDISTYAPGTYGIYLAFQRVEAEPQSRSIWSGVDLAEYSKVVPTRLAGIWQVRIENPAPGPEWTRIGDCTVVGGGSGQGNTVSVVDKRPLYFEGTFDAQYQPTWGTTADRQLRRSATITTFQQMVDALKACIIDLKGPNVARWYDPFITGFNVGPNFAPTDTPTAGRVAVGDANFYLQGDANLPALAFNGTQDMLQFNRSTGVLARYRSGQTVWQVNSSGYVQVGANGIYPSAVLNVHGAGAPRTLTVVGTNGFGSIAVGGLNSGNGGYIALGDGTTFGSTPRWGIFGGTSGSGLFQLQLNNNQGVFIECRPGDLTTYGNYTTTIQGSPLILQGTYSGSAVQLNSNVYVNGTQVVNAVLPWGNGGCVVGNSNPNGRVVTSNRGGTYNNGTDEIGGYIYFTFNDKLPNNAVITCTPTAYAVDGTKQLGYTCVAQRMDSYTLRFYVANAQGQSVFGNFNFTIDNAYSSY